MTDESKSEPVSTDAMIRQCACLRDQAAHLVSFFKAWAKLARETEEAIDETEKMLALREQVQGQLFTGEEDDDQVVVSAAAAKIAALLNAAKAIGQAE